MDLRVTYTCCMCSVESGIKLLNWIELNIYDLLQSCPFLVWCWVFVLSYSESHFSPQHLVIGPAVIYSHGSGTVDVHLIPTPRGDEVDHNFMPVCGTRMHPGGLAFILRLEHDVSWAIICQRHVFLNSVTNHRHSDRHLFPSMWM